MSYTIILAILILVLLGISLISKEVRDKIVSTVKEMIDKIFTRTPIALDEVVINPLKNQIGKFNSGRQTGGIKTL